MRILLADGYPPFRDALAGILKSLQPTAEVEMVDDYPTLLSRLRADRFKLVVADLSLPGLRGLADVVQVVNAAGMARVAVVADGHPLPIHRQVRLCGVTGLIEKTDPPAQIARAAAMMLRGGLAFPDTLAVPTPTALPERQPDLTSRQLEVLALLILGKPNKQIAKELSLSPNTVKAHVSEILRRLELTCRSDVIAMARQPLQVLEAAD